MKTFTTKKTLQHHILGLKGDGKTIGFVPTMGALHQGHLSLIAQARQFNDVIVCSIFVNPNQFNDPKDLEKYPRTIEADTRLLEQADCDILFYPAVNEIYDDNEQWHLDIGPIEHLLEGGYRPGHYQGVMQVVFKLFNIVTPDNAFFGQKDYQQYLVISKMVQMLKLAVKLVMCPIKREESGLAMSSRNIHLSAEDVQHALILPKTLSWLKANFSKHDINQLKPQAEIMIAQEPGVELDYLAIADGKTLQPATEKSETFVALVAAKVGDTRLIDNVILKGSIK